MELINRNLDAILKLVRDAVNSPTKDTAIVMYQMFWHELDRIKSIQFTPEEEEMVWNNYKQTIKMCYGILDNHLRMQEMDLEEWAKQLPMG